MCEVNIKTREKLRLLKSICKFRGLKFYDYRKVGLRKRAISSRDVQKLRHGHLRLTFCFLFSSLNYFLVSLSLIFIQPDAATNLQETVHITLKRLSKVSFVKRTFFPLIEQRSQSMRTSKSGLNAHQDHIHVQMTINTVFVPVDRPQKNFLLLFTKLIQNCKQNAKHR